MGHSKDKAELLSLEEKLESRLKKASGQSITEKVSNLPVEKLGKLYSMDYLHMICIKINHENIQEKLKRVARTKIRKHFCEIRHMESWANRSETFSDEEFDTLKTVIGFLGGNHHNTLMKKYGKLLFPKLVNYSLLNQANAKKVKSIIPERFEKRFIRYMPTEHRLTKVFILGESLEENTHKHNENDVKEYINRVAEAFITQFDSLPKEKKYAAGIKTFELTNGNWSGNWKDSGGLTLSNQLLCKLRDLKFDIYTFLSEGIINNLLHVNFYNMVVDKRTELDWWFKKVLSSNFNVFNIVLNNYNTLHCHPLSLSKTIECLHKYQLLPHQFIIPAPEINDSGQDNNPEYLSYIRQLILNNNHQNYINEICKFIDSLYLDHLAEIINLTYKKTDLNYQSIYFVCYVLEKLQDQPELLAKIEAYLRQSQLIPQFLFSLTPEQSLIELGKLLQKTQEKDLTHLIRYIKQVPVPTHLPLLDALLSSRNIPSFILFIRQPFININYSYLLTLLFLLNNKDSTRFIKNNLFDLLRSNPTLIEQFFKNGPHLEARNKLLEALIKDKPAVAAELFKICLLDFKQEINYQRFISLKHSFFYISSSYRILIGHLYDAMPANELTKYPDLIIEQEIPWYGQALKAKLYENAKTAIKFTVKYIEAVVKPVKYDALQHNYLFERLPSFEDICSSYHTVFLKYSSLPNTLQPGLLNTIFISPEEQQQPGWQQSSKFLNCPLKKLVISVVIFDMVEPFLTTLLQYPLNTPFLLAIAKMLQLELPDFNASAFLRRMVAALKPQERNGFLEQLNISIEAFFSEDSQNTHDSIVIQSCRVSILKLMHRYADKMNEHIYSINLNACLTLFPPFSPDKIERINSTLHRIFSGQWNNSPESYLLKPATNFTITLKHVLGLVYLAITDSNIVVHENGVDRQLNDHDIIYRLFTLCRVLDNDGYGTQMLCTTGLVQNILQTLELWHPDIHIGRDTNKELTITKQEQATHDFFIHVDKIFAQFNIHDQWAIKQFLDLDNESLLSDYIYGSIYYDQSHPFIRFNQLLVETLSHEFFLMTLEQIHELILQTLPLWTIPLQAEPEIVKDASCSQAISINELFSSEINEEDYEFALAIESDLTEDEERPSKKRRIGFFSNNQGEGKDKEGDDEQYGIYLNQ